MKIISTRVHGILDYVSGALLIALPWILNLNKYGYESFVLIGAGVLTLVISVLTRYELGVLKRIPMRNHLITDAITGVCLVLSPWVLDFNDVVFLPHVILGLLELAVVLLSDGRSVKDDKFLDVSEVYHIAHKTAEEGIRKPEVR